MLSVQKWFTKLLGESNLPELKQKTKALLSGTRTFRFSPLVGNDIFESVLDRIVSTMGLHILVEHY